MDKTRTLSWRIQFHKAMANPTRLEIIESLLEGERCQCEILPEINLSQSTVSSYLSQLVRAGVLSERKDGTKKLYRIANKEIREIITLVKETAQTQT